MNDNLLVVGAGPITAAMMGALGINAAMMPTFEIQKGSKTYPFSSTKQHRKHATRQVTVVRNGFEIMNTLKAKDRLSMSQVA